MTQAWRHARGINRYARKELVSPVERIAAVHTREAGKPPVQPDGTMATAKKAPAKKAPAKKAPPAKTAAAKTALQTPRGRAQDRALVSSKQKYEVSYEAAATGHSAADVKAAIEKFGHSRVKVRKALSEK